jgi:two-component system, OmpR family, heavy metal sensor histidine kinase CusS
MRSIRLSLLVYLLILLAVALGAASMLAYENARAILHTKTTLHGETLQAKYDEDSSKERLKLDNVLSWRVHNLERQIWRQLWERRMRAIGLAPLGMLNSGLDVTGIFWLPLWLTERNPFIQSLYRASVTDFQYVEPEHDEVLPGYANGQITEYFQINSDTGKVWRSRSMGAHTFHVDLGHLQLIQRDKSELDDVELAPGIPLRRVTLRTSMPRGPFPFFQNRGRRNGPPAGENPERAPTTPAFYLQVAAETAHRDEALADLKDKFEGSVAPLEEESRQQLAGLRNRLLFISLITFAATIIGGILLVSAGLAPLRRLSLAVSQVSEKDFRLPIDENQLPVELRPISKRLEQTLDQLKRAFAREKQAAADISHELRTPLAALLTTIEVGLRKQRSPDEYREMLEDCHATGLQMNHLVERLLTLARLDAGVDTLRARPVDVAALVEQCTEVVLPLAKAHGLSLTVHRNGPIEVNTDPDKLREVLNNLLHNAIEYNRPEGTIDVTVEQKTDSLRLEVRDSGIGIAPANREHIFERFFRADPSRQATGLHAGLGLAIVKNYVDLMGGVITIHSREGQGSTFVVELPIGRTILPRRISQESLA